MYAYAWQFFFVVGRRVCRKADIGISTYPGHYLKKCICTIFRNYGFMHYTAISKDAILVGIVYGFCKSKAYLPANINHFISERCGIWVI